MVIIAKFCLIILSLYFKNKIPKEVLQRTYKFSNDSAISSNSFFD